jgi:hypothetical protein
MILKWRCDSERKELFPKKAKPRTLFSSNHPEARSQGITCYDQFNSNKYCVNS